MNRIVHSRWLGSAAGRFLAHRIVAISSLATATLALIALAIAPSAHAKNEAYIKSNAVWPSAIVPVCWENPSAENAAPREWVMAALARSWEAVSGLDFVGWGQCAGNSPGIHVYWNDEGPHTKGLGTQLNGKYQGMVLNHTFNNWSRSCILQRQYCVETIAIHEFGHAIAFAHEQNRPDTPGWCDQEQGSNGDRLIDDWDLDSVMNYCNPHWSGHGLLSARDIRATQELYGVSLKAAQSVIGVVKHNEGCFYGEVVISMDDEDDDNKSVQTNVPAGISGGRNTRLAFCKEPVGGAYPQLLHNSFDYAVLRLSANCPAGSFPFQRHVDNEDDDNSNSSSGTIAPSVVNTNSTLEFCFVPELGVGWDLIGMPWSQNSGIFARGPGVQAATTYTFGSARSDDEDDDNANSYAHYNMPGGYVPRVEGIISPADGGANTVFYTAYQTGATRRTNLGIWPVNKAFYPTQLPVLDIAAPPGFYHRIELATESRLFDQRNHGASRTNENYFDSWWGGASEASQGVIALPRTQPQAVSTFEYQIPTKFWNAVKSRQSQVFFRLTVASDPRWALHVATTQDAAAQSAPSFRILKLGDINGDDCVDRSDLTVLMAILSASGARSLIYDLNGDGRTDIADARKLVTLFTRTGGSACSP